MFVLPMIKNDNTGKWKQFLASDAGKAKKFEVKKPSSDNTNTFFGWAKKKFGAAQKIHQCGAHASGQFNCFNFCFRVLTWILACAAIPFKNGKFKIYFDSDENWLYFHQLMSRLLRAHTEEMAHAIQQAICEWLLSVNEKRAEKLFRKTWCGERGTCNYTNASAGYVGNKVANSLESKWKYYRRDTTGTTGTNLRMPIHIFIPSHIKYIRDLSRWCMIMPSPYDTLTCMSSGTDSCWEGRSYYQIISIIPAGTRYSQVINRFFWHIASRDRMEIVQEVVSVAGDRDILLP